ncbi:FHA domain-containing protein [bacterium]|nr:FHA domain-containing protein [bacterium]
MKIIFEIGLPEIEVPQKDIYTIGRMSKGGETPANDFVLPIVDKRISRYQCYIEYEDESYYLYDGCCNDPDYGELAGKPSAFGTFLNGKRVTTTEGLPLQSGDYIEFLNEVKEGPTYRLRVRYKDE